MDYNRRSPLCPIRCYAGSSTSAGNIELCAQMKGNGHMYYNDFRNRNYIYNSKTVFHSMNIKKHL